MKEVIIKSKSKFYLIDFDELWRYRELFYIFTWRDIKVRYKQTVLGIAWVIFQPLITMVIFTIFFGNIAKISSNGLPYPLFVLVGLVFWTFFSGALTQASSSFLENDNLLKKVYFPKIILPISATITSLVDFSISAILLLIVIIVYRAALSPLLLIIFPLGVFITFLTASGLGLLLSSLNVKYRDVRYILPFFIQLLLFITPVIYPSSIINLQLRYLLALNPMTGVIESIRALISNLPIDINMLLISMISAVIFFILGLLYFRSTEDFFADII